MTDNGFPDPTILIDGKVWWAYATSSDNNGHIPLAGYNDGNKWIWEKMDAMPDVSPSWIDSGEGIWAPSVFKNDNGKYVIYYESSSSVLLTSTIILPGGIITTNHLGLR